MSILSLTMEPLRFTLTLLNPDVVQQPVTLITYKRKHCCIQKVMSTNKPEMSIRNGLVNHTQIGLVLQTARSSFTRYSVQAGLRRWFCLTCMPTFIIGNHMAPSLPEQLSLAQ